MGILLKENDSIIAKEIYKKNNKWYLLSKFHFSRTLSKTYLNICL